jgi:hypothetical protein
MLIETCTMLWRLDVVQGLCKHYMYTRGIKLQLVPSRHSLENIMLSTSSLLHCSHGWPDADSRPVRQYSVSILLTTCSPSLTLALPPSSALIPIELYNCHKHVVLIPSLPQTPRYLFPSHLHHTLPFLCLLSMTLPPHFLLLSHPTPASSSVSTPPLDPSQSNNPSSTGRPAGASRSIPNCAGFECSWSSPSWVVSSVSGCDGKAVGMIAKVIPGYPGYPHAEVQVQVQVQVQTQIEAQAYMLDLQVELKAEGRDCSSSTSAMPHSHTSSSSLPPITLPA